MKGETVSGEVRHRRIDSVHFITSRHAPSPTLAWLLTNYLQAPDGLLYMRGHLHNVMHLIATLPAQSVLVYTRWCDRHCRVTGACPSIPISSPPSRGKGASRATLRWTHLPREGVDHVHLYNHRQNKYTAATTR